MGPEPSVNTWYMEGVTALGQQPHQIPIFKITQANRAVRRSKHARPSPVLSHRDGLDGGLVQPDGADVPDMVDRVVAQVRTRIRPGVRREGRGGSEGLQGAPPAQAAVEEDEHGGGQEGDEEEAGEDSESEDGVLVEYTGFVPPYVDRGTLVRGFLREGGDRGRAGEEGRRQRSIANGRGGRRLHAEADGARRGWGRAVAVGEPVEDPTGGGHGESGCQI